jgi:probable rRNA maturation factor
LGRDDAELSVLLAGDCAVRRLNREWRGRDAPTDVLAFPTCAPPGGEAQADGFVLLGDVVISLDAAAAQAAAAGVSRWREVRRLLAHGILHLLGYDHERSPAAARRMRALEDRLVAGDDG